MPLMQGKSKASFGHNVETEMHAGKPQKQSLAIAYAVKRKAQKKKMAEGGEISPEDQGKVSMISRMAPTSNDSVSQLEEKKKTLQSQLGSTTSYAGGGMVDNEDLNPRHEASHEVENQVLTQMDYSPYRQDQGPLPHPEEPEKHVYPAPENMKEHMFAKGGMLEPRHMASMILKKRNHLYKGGQPAGMHDVYPQASESNETGDYDMDRDEYLADRMGDLEYDKHPHSWDQYEGDTGDTVPADEYPYKVSSDGAYAEGGEVGDDPKSRKKMLLSKIMSSMGR